MSEPDERARRGVTYLRPTSPIAGERRGGLRRHRPDAPDRSTFSSTMPASSGSASPRTCAPQTGTAVLNTHLTGLFLCAAEAMRRMRRAGQGRRHRQHRLGRRHSSASRARPLQRRQGRHRGPDARSVAGDRHRQYPRQRRRPGFTRTKLIEQGLADGSIRGDWHDRARADGAARRAERRSPTRSSISPATRPATSPARRWSSTAAGPCRAWCTSPTGSTPAAAGG